MATSTCDDCGAPVPADMPAGLCPRCLFMCGLAETGADPALEPAPPDLGSILAGSASPFAVKLQSFGDYELIGEIARGGMGTVFKARQCSLNRMVALKVISAGVLATRESTQRFQAEARAAASLKHPNIVAIHEIGEHQGYHFFSMELVDGPTLSQLLSRARSEGMTSAEVGSAPAEVGVGRPLVPFPDLRAAVRVLRLLARAVQYAHHRGILHRDLKPGNILIDADGEPRLTDFGLAKFMEKDVSLTHTRAVLGTPAYMSPEQARGDTREVTAAADVYGLGAILYELVTGMPPFAGASSLEVIRNVLEREPRRPSALNRGVDRDLETICLRCLEKDPARRYVSAEALAEELERWERGDPIRARPITGIERTARWVKRRPAISALCAVSSLSMLALVIGSTAVSLGSLFALAAGSTVAALRVMGSKRAMRRLVYALEMNIAYEAWHAGDVVRTRALLAKQLPQGIERDLRRWEWWYLSSCDRNQEIDEWCSSSGAVSGVAYSPDGQVLATHGRGPTQLWEVASRRPVLVLGGDEWGWGDAVAFSPDGRLLLTTYRDEPRIRVWEVATGRLRGVFAGHRLTVASAAFVQQGSAIVSAGGIGYGSCPRGELKLWDVSTFAEKGAFEDVRFPVLRCDVSPDGRWVAGSGIGPVVQVWDLASRRVVARFTGHDARNKGGVFALRFSPDSRFLATGDIGGIVRLWDLQSGEASVVGTHGGPVYCLSFSPDGERLVSGSRDHTLRTWNLRSPDESAILRGHLTRVLGLAVSPDGATLASGGLDGSVKFWSVRQTAGSNVVAHTHGDGSVAFSGDGRFLLWQDCGQKELVLWDIARARIAWQLDGVDFAVSAMGDLLAVVSPVGKLRLWRLGSRTEIPLANEIPVRAGDEAAVAFSRCGSRLAVIGPQGELVVWSLPGGDRVSTIKARLRDGWVHFLPDGRSVLSGGLWNEVVAWRIGEDKPLRTFTGHSLGVRAVAISPDGRLLATGSEDTTVRLWNLRTGGESGVLVGGAGAVCSLAFSPDGETLAAGSFEGVIQLWNVGCRQQVGSLPGHVSFVRSLAFSRDGRVLASSSMDNTVRLWRTAG